MANYLQRFTPSTGLTSDPSDPNAGYNPPSDPYADDIVATDVRTKDRVDTRSYDPQTAGLNPRFDPVVALEELGPERYAVGDPY